MQKAVVLGGSGFIGKACLDALAAEGFAVLGVSRSKPAGTVHEWVTADLGNLDATGWRELLAGADVVVNAAGALQTGARDDLTSIHVTMVERLVAALDGQRTRVIQISAVGVSKDASTEFFRTKAAGDNILMNALTNWVVLRPALVLGSEAYGGTAMLRAHAGFPGIRWRMFEAAFVQTVALSDVVKAVILSAIGQVKPGSLFNLADTTQHSFAALSDAMRRWQGFDGRRIDVRLSGWMISLAAKGADVLGYLGWRSPLRTTALRVMDDGILAEGHDWTNATGHRLLSLDQTLAALPAHSQERWFARMFLFLPFSIAVLSLFWCLSGVIGLVRLDHAMTILTDRGMASAMAKLAVLGGGFVDLLLGGAILIRRWTRAAAMGMFLVSLIYLVGAAFVAPDLWADPMGPMVKVLPAMALALVPLLFLEKR